MEKEYACHACGSVSDTHVQYNKPPHIGLICKDCGTHITWLVKPVSDFEFWFGKYKGCKLSEMTTPDHVSWLKWCLANCTNLKTKYVDLVKKHVGL